MAETTFTTNNALTKKLWDEKLYRDVLKRPYFSRFQAENSDALCHVKTQLEKSQGDKITFGIRMRLSGAGVTGDSQLEGNEEALVTHDFSLSLEQYRHGVRDNGALSRKRAMFSITEESEAAIKDWMVEKIDSLSFTALASSPTLVVYPNASGVFSKTGTPATAVAAMHATNSKITSSFIRKLKTYAKTGGNRSFVPLRPVKIDGRDYLVLLVHDDVLYDLKEDSDFKNAQREAMERGRDNPLFTGAEAVYDGVIIHAHENVGIFTDGGGASVAYAKCTLMGAQALCWAWGKRPETTQETFDYGNKVGTAICMQAAVGKPVFNSDDYGSIGVYVSRSQISDA